MSTSTKLVIFGRQGAGKGTQAARIVDHYGVAHISTGDMLRAERDAGTELGLKANEYMSAGNLVPDDVIIGVAKSRLTSPEVEASGFILDGFPRTIDQAQALIDHLGTAGLDAVINLEVPLDEVKTRMMSRGREDDTEEAIAQRLDLYEQETRPVLAWFAEQGLLVTVDGLGAEEEIFGRLTAVIDDLLAKRS